MKRYQTPHAFWIFLIMTLITVHYSCASSVSSDTTNESISKSSSVDTLNTFLIFSDEEKKIQKIEADLTRPKFTKNIDTKANYIYKELGEAAHNKHLHVIDHLLSLNFEHHEYLLLNSSLAQIAGIPAARGDEDLVIIEKILNAKQNAFIHFGKINEHQHKAEMTEIANKILAFSATNNHCTLVQRILDSTALLYFDVNSVNWALRNIMRSPNSIKKYESICLLYEKAQVNPDLEGTIDALEIALASNNDKALYAVLQSSIMFSHFTFTDILKKTTLNLRAQIVHKLIDCTHVRNEFTDFLIPDENSKILALIKFYTDSKNASSRVEKEKMIVIAYKILAKIINHEIPHINVACCELVETVYELHAKMNETGSISEYSKYISNRDRFKENLFPIFSLQIHKKNGLELHPDIYQQLVELWNELLIQSAMFGDYQMGTDLLSEKYFIKFEQKIIQSAIDGVNTRLQEYELPPAKKIKKEHEAPSESDVFLNLLKSKNV